MNQTIYFRKDIWTNFQNETGKSNLVNQLLATHYGLNQREVTISDSPILKKFIIKTKDDVAKVIKPYSEAPKNFCRIHGIRFDARGRCLQKGCKYA